METFQSLAGLFPQVRVPSQIVLAEGCYVHKNRNEIVQRAQELKAKWLLFIDTDISFPVDALDKLMKLDVDVAAAAYNYRRTPQESTIKLLGPDGDIAPGTFSHDKPFQCYAAATGFMLIKMSVFDKLPKPYFFFRYVDGKLEGEDIYFCRTVREAGLEVWCDPTIQLKHYGSYGY